MLISAAFLSSGCSHLQWVPGESGGASASDASGALVWWGRAVDASPAARESMLRSARQGKSAWKVAMLRSLPGSTETETPEASQDALRNLQRRGLRDDEAILVRIRLVELERNRSCQSEATELRSQLNRIIQIEREMGNGR
ncbi:hypothetical protein DFR24_4726 [Panacagrimonas perspica]|uniref:Uncharacterized protein n=2 Tax=Panacagrimonas perspica TaxID=381431 RepID=A0A4R7NQJ1_9GAMM|nr:hypothetical protein DFR24_4726 [Panacagrimonas perspica]